MFPLGSRTVLTLPPLRFSKDLLRAAWSQRGRLVAGFLKKRDPRKAALNSIRAVRFNQRNEAPSPLQLQVHPATPEGPRSAIDAVPASESREDDSRLTSSDGALDLSSIHPPLAISEGEAQHVIATPETSHHAGDLTTPASSRLSKFFQKISRKRANSGSSSEDAEERGRSKDGSSLARAASASPERSTWTKRERVISESSALAPAAPNGNPSRDIFAQSSNGLRSAPLSVTPALPPIDTSSELLSGRATLAPSPALRSDSSTSDRDRGFISSLSSSLGLSGGGNGGEHPHGHPQRPSSPESVQSARSGGQGSSIKRTLRGYDRGADTHASPRSALVGLSEADKARMLLGDVRHEDE